MNGNEKIRKATTHISQNEVLIFERSSAGKKAYMLPPPTNLEMLGFSSQWTQKRS